MKIIYFLIFILSSSFKIQFNKNNKSLFQLLCNNKDENNNNEQEIKIINLDKLIETYDNIAIKNLQGKIPKIPQTEEEIQEESFEGYLKTHFNVIKNLNEKCSYEKFYKWRSAIGVLLPENEVKQIFDSVSKDECTLMEFIKINTIIDEIDGAKF